MMMQQSKTSFVLGSLLIGIAFLIALAGCGGGSSATGGGSGAPTITTTTLPDGMLAVSYSTTLQASGGMQPYNWTITAGGQPPNTALDASGTLAGLPGAVGTSTFTVTVTDANNNSASRQFNLTIQNNPNPVWRVTLAIPQVLIPWIFTTETMKCDFTINGQTRTEFIHGQADWRDLANVSVSCPVLEPDLANVSIHITLPPRLGSTTFPDAFFSDHPQNIGMPHDAIEQIDQDPPNSHMNDFHYILSAQRLN